MKQTQRQRETDRHTEKDRVRYRDIEINDRRDQNENSVKTAYNTNPSITIPRCNDPLFGLHDM